MLDRVVALLAVAVCFSVVQQLHHGVIDAGGPPAVSARARQRAVSRPQLTDKRNHVELTIPGLLKSTRSGRAMFIYGKRRRKFIDGTRHINQRNYVRVTRRARKSLKSADQPQTGSTVDSVDEMERQLRQYQARRIAEEIARLRTTHRNLDTAKNRRRHRRRCRTCRRRHRLRGRRRTTSSDVTPKTTSLTHNTI